MICKDHLKTTRLVFAANTGILSIASSFMGASAVCGFDCDQGVTALARNDHDNDRNISTNSPARDRISMLLYLPAVLNLFH